MLSRTIENEGYTLASMIRDELFHKGATFASCIVSHPQSYELDITIEGENPNEILRSAVECSSLRLKACTQALDNFSSLQKEMDVVEKKELVVAQTKTSKKNVHKSTRANKPVIHDEDKMENPQESGRRKRRTRHNNES